MRIFHWRKNKALTMQEAVEQCSLSTESLLANLLKLLINRKIISNAELEALFEHDFSVEDDK